MQTLETNPTTHDVLARSNWDRFVSECPDGHFMQSYSWGELQRNYGWTPHYITIGDAEHPRALALLLSRRLPLTNFKVFYCPRGPVLSHSGDNIISEATSRIREFIRHNHGIFVRFDPYVTDSEAIDRNYLEAGKLKADREWSYWNAPKFVLWLNLDRDEAALLKGTTSSCQRDLKAGYKKDVEYTRGSLDDIEEFHRLMVNMSASKGIAVRELAYFRDLYSTLNRSCQLELFLARHRGKPIASGMSVMFGKRAWLLYAAADREFSKLGASRNLQWEMIKWAHAAGCTRYDFRGTATGDPPSEADPGYGVYQFKKSFGPEFTRLAGYFDLVGSPIPYKALRLAEDRMLPAAYRAKVWLDERRQ